MALCVLLGLIGPASAGQHGAVQPRWPAVMTLEEAALFLRVNRAELSQMAEWGLVPARRIGAYWRLSRTALLDWLKTDHGAYMTLPTAAYPPSVPSAANAGLVPRASAAQPLPASAYWLAT